MHFMAQEDIVGACCLCPFQSARDLTGCYLDEHTGMKWDLQLHLSTQPGCPGDKRPRVGVIVILLCPSKSLTTHCPFSKYKSHYKQSETQAGEGNHALCAMLSAKPGSANWVGCFSKQSLQSQPPQTPQPGVTILLLVPSSSRPRPLLSVRLF